MLIRLGNVHGEISGVFDAVVAIGCQAHQVGTTALYLHHVADHLIEQLALGKGTDHKSSLLNQALCI